MPRRIRRYSAKIHAPQPVEYVNVISASLRDVEDSVRRRIEASMERGEVSAAGNLLSGEYNGDGRRRFLA